MTLGIHRADPLLLMPRLWELLDGASAEFIPPLASRSSTTQADLSPAASTDLGVLPYLEALSAQELLVASRCGEMAGFISFRDHHRLQIPGASITGPYRYLTTIIVADKFRGLGVGRALYQEALRSAQDEPVAVRTWSTNGDHLRLLNRFGFTEVSRVVDDRGAGIDTLYYIHVVSSTP